jgi:hypothetical protein
MTGENQSTWRNANPGATSSTTNLKLTSLESNQGLFIERPATNRQSYGMALLNRKFNLLKPLRFSSYRVVNTFRHSDET